MNNIDAIDSIELDNSALNIGLLWNKAREYGRVTIFTAVGNKRYSVTITLVTPNNIEIKAESGYNHDTVESALEAAIQNAEKIRKMMK